MSDVSPEMEAFAQRFAKIVQDAVCLECRQSGDRVAARLEKQLAELELRLQGRIDGLRAEVERRLSGISDEQDAQRNVLAAQSVDLARIQERLTAGDRKFDSHELRLQRIEAEGKPIAVAQAVAATRLRQLSSELARLSTAGAGGGVAIYILQKLLG